MKGILNFYFPCVVTAKSVKELRKRWEQCRKRQRDFVESAGLPSTDLLDLEDYRNEVEEILNQFVYQTLPTCECYFTPFATRGIQKAYHSKREDTLFSKNLNVIVSEFTLSCCKGKIEWGRVLLNINAENNIATFIVITPFSNFDAEKIIFLKHVFYKRLKVSITEKGKNIPEENTIQRYISDLIHSRLGQLKIRNVDYRARYSFLEINEGITDLTYLAKEYYGMLVADESYKYVKEERLRKIFGHNLFHHNTRGYYISGTNAIVLHKLRNCHDVFKKSCAYANQQAFIRVQMHEKESDSDKLRQFFKKNCDNTLINGYISTKDESYNDEKTSFANEPAGTKNNLMPEFLRAVELHYLLDRVMSSEIVIQKRDQLNPFIFVPRALKLWNILYDKAVNKYHLNNALLNAFGIRVSNLMSPNV